MKIAMRKISHSPKDIALTIDNEGETITEHITLEGQIKRIDSQMLSLEGKIRGQIELICDVSGELYIQELDYPLALYIADGIWNIQSQSKRLDSFEVIEFFDGFVDLTYILASEIETIRSDYHTKEEYEE
ncbi:hypothetical protein [uncultured Helicobacter sp.]|uniref:hypothetical protein n=1 Tax=uncultured Helicobacter sp. TaxID=175537 RepID=UPI002613699E|nr:hypothetical protein [uncultured Helicobacter sp.]